MTRPLTKHDLERLWVFREVAKAKVPCSLGELHDVRLVIRKSLGPVVDWALHDNGYGVDTVPVRLDAQGRTYSARFPIDFYGTTTWWRADPRGDAWGQHWSGRPPSPGPVKILTPAEFALINRDRGHAYSLG